MSVWGLVGAYFIEIVQVVFQWLAFRSQAQKSGRYQ